MWRREPFLQLARGNTITVFNLIPDLFYLPFAQFLWMSSALKMFTRLAGFKIEAFAMPSFQKCITVQNFPTQKFARKNSR